MRWLLLVALAACSDPVDAGGGGIDAGPDDDPLLIEFVPEPGSLDDIQQRVISPRCSGQPGLCHNGQFEPNLSTAANSYAYLVNRPGLEKSDRFRVRPGDPDGSLLVDKLRGRDVATQMPLGADPLSDEDLEMIEAWIDDGALRRPGADPAPVLNNPPAVPEIAIYEDDVRLDSVGNVQLQVGQTLWLRHSVADFETADADIPFAAVVLSAADGRNVVLDPAADDPGLGATAYDAAGPMGAGDLLDFRRGWTVPAMVTLVDGDTGDTEDVPADGLMLTPIVLYIDDFPGGILAFSIGRYQLQLEAP